MGQATLSSSIHPILCFAHRGEAKAFLAELPFRPYQGVEDTYQYIQDETLHTLTITGEGPDRALSKLSFVLGHLLALHPEKNFGVFNLGVAGLLRRNENLEIGKAYIVRTTYGADTEGRPLFKSFSGNLIQRSENPLVDCITSSKRILENENAENLSHFASLVDREAHSIGTVCDQIQIPFAVIKVISDEARGEICLQVKDEAPLWSDLLLKKYLEVFSQTKLPYSSDLIKDDAWDLMKDLHVTVSQERLLGNFLKACELKGIQQTDALNKAGLPSLLKEDIRPKDKTKKLLEALAEVINPLDSQLKEKLKELISPLEENGFKVRFEQGYEDDTLHLTTSLQHPENINRLIQGLESFDYLKLKSLFRGEDV